MRVLVVEDDRALGGFLKMGLELDGHQVEWVKDGEAALVEAAAQHPDLVLLDLSLPKRDGTEVLAELRARQNDAIVLVLSGRNEVNVRVQCLDMGADDYLPKPFSFFELTARCRALLRRRRSVVAADPVLRHGELKLHRMEHRVTLEGREIKLTAKEFALLEYLLAHPDECVSRSQLLAEAWKMPDETAKNLVDVYINYLRRKLVDSCGGSLIETVRGEGYRLSRVEQMPVGLGAAHLPDVAIHAVAYA
jgi:DNA-binding response OmpR family regulator